MFFPPLKFSLLRAEARGEKKPKKTLGEGRISVPASFRKLPWELDLNASAGAPLAEPVYLLPACLSLLIYSQWYWAQQDKYASCKAGVGM